MIVLKRLLIMLFALTFIPNQVFAISQSDLHAVMYDTVFYDETSSGGSSGSCSTGSIPSSTNLDKSTINAINMLKPAYVEAATKLGIPWQLLAAVHYRENNNDPNGDLQAGNAIGGPYSQSSTSYKTYGYPKTIAESAEIAGKVLIAMSGGGVVKKPINVASPDPEAIKDVLFSYNGRSSKYAEQAALYGFSSKTQPYEGSPYVMNRYDAQRQSMGIITQDFGPIDGHDTRFGAFTIYSRLGGAAGGGDSCTGVDASGIVGIALKELGTTGPTSSGYFKYSDNNDENWCADYVSWVFRQAGKPFTGGSSGGWRIAGTSTMRDWFKTNGTWIDNTAANRASNPPLPGDVIVYIHGHVNIVVSVSGTSAKIVGGNQGNNDNNLSSVTTHGQDLTDSDVEGWGRMK